MAWTSCCRRFTARDSVPRLVDRDAGVFHHDRKAIAGAEVLVEDDRPGDYNSVAHGCRLLARDGQVVAAVGRVAGAILEVDEVPAQDAVVVLDDLAAQADLLARQ